MADEDLLAEVARLRAENAALKRRGASRAGLRRGASVGLLVLGCGCAALAVLGIWLRATLLDTDRYVRTVAPIAARPAVQTAVADRLSAEIDQRVDFDGLIRGVLPERAAVLAPAIDRGVQSFVRSQIDDFTRSQRFRDLWTLANRRAHTRVIELLEGGRSGKLVLEEDTVYLDLSPMVDRVRIGLQNKRLGAVAAAIPASIDGRIQLIQAPALVDAQRGVRLLKTFSILLPLLSLASLAGFVWLSRSRRRGLLVAALGVAAAMLVLIAALAVTRSAYLDALGQRALSRRAAADVFDALTTFPRDGLRVVLAVAVALALIALLVGLPVATAFRRVVDDERRAAVARHRTALLGVVAVVGAVVLVGRDPLTGRDVLVVVLAMAVAAAAIVALTLGHPEREPEGALTPEA